MDPRLKIISKNFSKKSENYDYLANIQKYCAKNLFLLFKDYINYYDKILDLGSGSSFVAKNIIDFFPKNSITEIDISKEMINLWHERPENVFVINGDINKINDLVNIKDFRVITSSFAIQWLSDIDNFLQMLNKNIGRNQILCFCFPSHGSLKEIVNASEESFCNFNFLDFPKEFSHKINTRTDFRILEHKIETIKINHSSAVDCLRKIKNLGANFSSRKNIINKRKLQNFNDFFLINSNNIISWKIEYFLLTS